MSARLDPRLNAYRLDLAAESLRGQVDSARFVTGEVRQMARAFAPLKGKPETAHGLDNEILFGELVTVFDESDGWAWVQLHRDGYVGYTPASGLRRHVLPTTHRVSALGTFVYPVPDIKTSPLMHLSMNSELSVMGHQDQFMSLANGGWVISRHVLEKDRFALDFVAIAERFIGTPYLWGGRTRLGVDCSGLVQIALEAAGQACPRDSDMQQAALGAGIAIPADLDGLDRGDLVFWPHHVGIMVDSVMLIHANAHHMAVAVEPLQDAVERIARSGSRISMIKRLESPAGTAA